MMKDPVIATDGYSYERDEIQKHFSNGGKYNKFCNRRTISNKLTSNFALKSVINRVKENKQKQRQKTKITQEGF